MGNVEGSISTTLLDGRYINIINDEMLEIKDGKLTIDKNPVVMKGQNTFFNIKIIMYQKGEALGIEIPFSFYLIIIISLE